MCTCAQFSFRNETDAGFCPLFDSMQRQKQHLCKGHSRQKGPEAVGCRQVSELSQAMVIGDGGAGAGDLKEFLLEQKDRKDFSLHLHFLSFCYS